MVSLDYASVCNYLDSTQIFGIKPGLLRIDKILSLYKDPQKNMDFIHIVGTNGKTSVTKFTAAILHAHGIRSAYYVSPHVKGYTERISIAGAELSEQKFAQYFTELYPLIEEVNKMDLDGELSQFEILTALFFYAAFREKIQVAVIEAGMGGRWDATNAVKAKVVGFTDVSLEHTKILGNTISKITWEKAMVIKEKVSVVTTSKKKKVLEILRQRVQSTGSKLYIYGKDFKIEGLKKSLLEAQSLSIKGITADLKDLSLPLMGDYQAYNLALSTALCELYLKSAGIRISREAVNCGARTSKIYGRLEILRRDPILIADASHNAEGIKNLMKNLEGYFPSNKKIIIFSVLSDKEYKKMIREVLKADILILTSSLDERSLAIEEIEKEVRKNAGRKDQKIHKLNNIAESLKFALNIASHSDIICLTGSITNLESIYKDFV